MDIQEKIKCIIGCAVALIIILIVLSIVYLGCNKNSSPIINSLTLIGSYIGAITTLAAAYIASLLFNHWRDQEAFCRKQKMHDEAIDIILKSTKRLSNLNSHIDMLKQTLATKKLTPEEDARLSKELSKETRNTIKDVQDLTHNICVKIAFDYSKSIQDDNELKFVFDVLLEIKVFVQKVAHDRGINKDTVLYVQEFIRELNIKLDSKLQNYDS